MRTKKQMMDLILNFAQTDDRIRAVAMNGSRLDENITPDRFQDYDVVYFVREMESFLTDPAWVDYFGPRIIMQTPEDGRLFPPELGGWYTYLMLFEDENRIDLMLIPLSDTERYCKADTLTKILLDKDGLFPALPAPSDAMYHIKRPSAERYAGCCNEFWWVSTYVAKGLCRRKIHYAIWHLNQCLREELLRMLSWQVGIQTDFSLSVGKCYQNLPYYLEEETSALLLSASRQDGEAACWDALFAMCTLFSEASRFVAGQLGFAPPEEEEGVRQYLQRLFEAYPPRS